MKVTRDRFRDYLLRSAEVDGTTLYYLKDISKILLDGKADTIGFRNEIGASEVLHIPLNPKNKRHTRGYTIEEVGRIMRRLDYPHIDEFMNRYFKVISHLPVPVPAVEPAPEPEPERSKKCLFIVSAIANKGVNCAAVWADNKYQALEHISSHLPSNVKLWVHQMHDFPDRAQALPLVFEGSANG